MIDKAVLSFGFYLPYYVSFIQGYVGGILDTIN